MKIDEAIEKAIDGGYTTARVWFLPLSTGEYVGNDIRYFVLDPLFWQSLGRALAWEKVTSGKTGRKGEILWTDKWRYEWHRFIDHLAEGGTAETYFKTLK